jgi:iron complex transport system substrate-binding protein
MRVVTLTCSNTEIVCALGRADDLVGVDDWSDYPPEVVGRLPRVGPDLGIDVEAVKRLQPDLVLASLTVPGHEKVVEQIAAAGLKYIAPAPESLPDVARDVRQIAGLLGVAERGERLARELELAFAPVHQEGERPKIAIQWWPKPAILPGRRSWAHDLVELAGGQSLLGDEEVKSRPVTDEEFAELAPDAVVISWCGVEVEKYRPEVVARNPLWQEVPAIKNGRIFKISEAYLGRPGPRLREGLMALRAVVESCRKDS